MHKIKWLLIVSIVIATTGAGFAIHNQWPFKNFPNPNRPDSIAVFMANGIYDANDPDYVAPTGEDFDRIIMGRDDHQIAKRKQRAIDFFLERFGVDFNDGDFAQDGNVILLHNYQDPRQNYRCYRLPDRYVPRAGLIVHDSNYALAVVGPNVVLYGSWGGEEGTEVPVGTVAVDGEYLIQGTNRFRRRSHKNVYLTFSSSSPIFDAFSGDIKFNCVVGNSCFGLGAAVGRQELYVLSDGMTQASIQNVLQFPAPDWILQQ